MKTIQCPMCGGSGLDPIHEFSPGVPASCAECEGYGTLEIHNSFMKKRIIIGALIGVLIWTAIISLCALFVGRWPSHLVPLIMGGLIWGFMGAMVADTFIFGKGD